MHTVMIIDDNVLNLSLAMSALESHYATQTLTSGRKALAFLRNTSHLPDLILLDVDMPDMSGFETLRQLKNISHLASIPVIFLTAANDLDSELKGLSLGARDYITKPFTPSVLEVRVGLHIEILEQKRSLEHYNKHLQQLVDEKTEKILRLQDSIVYSVSDLIEKKDGYTGGHTQRVSAYVRLLLGRLTERDHACEVPRSDIDAIAMSALLHDAGKIAIPDSILLKKGKLEPQEFAVMKTHTSSGADSILKFMMTPEEFAALHKEMHGNVTRIVDHLRRTRKNDFLVYALDMARSHHEKWNGTGYPDELSGTDIPLTARVTAIADVYDALRSERPYKKAFAHEQAVEIIRSEAGIAFDPTVAEVFLEVEGQLEKLGGAGRLDTAYAYTG